ncbi:hypothetical protein ASPVEDRAFT_508064 [Aspergillus versicolor CBS 583.65]|uniref:Uncharacterized protein n=1 Tax=Aspergillus versicolor CBS 583.65 TaxID=1036611 RepID=A0A1L9PCN5_ASPVE|nr:uncharacterized protein ASPVEDRAFT_508064 [Aspergillus versicolor CBS 583.65]OJI99278.1 hypothetical protein ASPVEDRAFT_508064 [Aspergillus versicolor CBS 583.65]
MESFKRRWPSSTEEDGDNKRLCRGLMDGPADTDAVFNYIPEGQAQSYPQLCGLLNDQQFAVEEEYFRGTTSADNMDQYFYPGDGAYALPEISSFGDISMLDYNSMDFAFGLPEWSSYDNSNDVFDSTHQLCWNQPEIELGNDITDLSSLNVGPVEQTTPSLLEVPTISPSPISTRIATPGSISEVPGYRCSTITASSDTLRPLPAHESLGAETSTSDKMPEMVDESISRDEDAVMENGVEHAAEGAQFNTCFGEVRSPCTREIQAKKARLWWG